MLQLANPSADFSTAELNPVDLSMATMKEITGQWLVKMYDYISNNSDFIVNGFLHSGISKALDGILTDDDFLSWIPMTVIMKRRMTVLMNLVMKTMLSLITLYCKLSIIDNVLQISLIIM